MILLLQNLSGMAQYLPIHLGLYFLSIFRDAEVTDLRKQLQSHQENIQKLHSEREDLMQKIQDGEGTNAALQQLKEQNVRLVICELTRIKIH